MNLPVRIAAAAVVGLLAAVVVAPGAAVLDGSTPPRLAEPGHQVAFDDVCGGVLVRLTNRSAERPVTFRVNGRLYRFPPGLAPEPLLVPVGVVGVALVETGDHWLHVWVAPPGCGDPPDTCTAELPAGPPAAEWDQWGGRS